MNRIPRFLPIIVVAFLATTAQQASAQVFLDAEWLFWDRNNNNDAPLIVGPDAFNAGDAGNGFESGYRFSLGAGLGPLEVEASFSQFNWESMESGVLVSPFALDDTAGDGDVFIAVPVNSLGVPTAIFNAAALNAAEMDESEHLEAGATYRFGYDSTLDDFELMINMNRKRYPLRFGMGWRHLELNETSGMFVTGVFNARDVDDGAVPGDDGNDGIAHASLTGAGFVNVAGTADGYAGYDPTDLMATPVTLGLLLNGTAKNDLDGLQAMLAAHVHASDYLIIESYIKGGLYHNRVSGTVQETLVGLVNDDSVYRRTLTGKRTVPSFAGGLGVRLIVPVTDFINIRTGYEVLYLTNVALGPEQSNGVRTTLLGATVYRPEVGGVFVAHGGNIGLEITF